MAEFILKPNQAALILESSDDGEINVDIAIPNDGAKDGVLAAALCRVMAKKLVGDEPRQRERPAIDVDRLHLGGLLCQVFNLDPIGPVTPVSLPGEHHVVLFTQAVEERHVQRVELTVLHQLGAHLLDYP